MPVAVTKIWAIHDSVSRVVEYCSNPEKTKLTDLEQVLIYAANKAKTLDEGEQSYAVSCVNCTPDTAIKEMTATQKRFGKTGGNVAYHAYQSFKTGEVSAAECQLSGTCGNALQYGNLPQSLRCELRRDVGRKKAGSQIRRLLSAPRHVGPYLQGTRTVGGKESAEAQIGAFGLLCRKER